MSKFFAYYIYILIGLVIVFSVNAAIGADSIIGTDGKTINNSGQTIEVVNGDLVRCYVAYNVGGKYIGNWYKGKLIDADLAYEWLVDFGDSRLFTKEQLGHATVQNVRSNDCLLLKDIYLAETLEKTTIEVKK